MKLKLIHNILMNGNRMLAGEVVKLSAQTAEELIKNRLAVAVDDPEEKAPEKPVAKQKKAAK